MLEGDRGALPVVRVGRSLRMPLHAIQDLLDSTSSEPVTVCPLEAFERADTGGSARGMKVAHDVRSTTVAFGNEVRVDV